MPEQIPGPKGKPFVGNLLDMDVQLPIRGLERLADQYGPIYQITLKGRRTIVCSSAAMMQELTDEKRFVKVPPSSIASAGGPKGLFAARNEDPDWEQGHRILMPSFSPLAVQDMFEGMKDIANQLILSWARKGPEHVISATEDFTRLTLDTIALCTFDFRFNSFYQEAMHPFVDAMVAVLNENSDRTARPALLTKMMVRKGWQHEANRQYLRKVGMDIIQDRRNNPVDRKDVLNTMIYGKDPKTGQVMRDELISEQMLTFLIAGHETTSGMLSFAFAQMLKNPDTYFKAQQEVDQVIGTRPIEYGDIKNLKYLNAILREALRVNPTVPLMMKAINPDRLHETVTLDGYVIEPDDRIMCLMIKAQKDPKVWGEDADQFNPDRMSDENFDKMSADYPGTWKPFGNGKRSCIGRAFAWQEALIVVAMVLQNFDVKLDDPSYQIHIKQSLTIKPADFNIRVSPRRGVTATSVDRSLHEKPHSNGVAAGAGTNGHAQTNGVSKRPMSILYGSNTGTCQALAQKAAAEAASHGFAAEVNDMDSAAGKLSKSSGPVLIFTASYEGEPPDNAVKFIQWLQTVESGSLSGVEYTVFGCGHRDWSHTFHRIPKLADELMAKAGATRVTEAGFTDASKGQVYGDFEDWMDNHLWSAFKSSSDAPKAEDQHPHVGFELSSDARATALRFDVHPATVMQNFKITSGNEPEKFHLELALPSDSAYECGDYLAVLPQNSESAVRNIMSYFHLAWDAVITLKGDGPSAIPLNTPTPVFEILRSYVELSQPVTKKQLRLVSTFAEDEESRTTLSQLADDESKFTAEITTKRISLMHILVQYPSIDLPIGLFLTLLPPLQVRQYSISSSPLACGTSSTNTCSLTYGILDTSHISDSDQRFLGVTSNYLRTLSPGDQVLVSVRPTAKKTFRLPLDLANTPMVMFAAGTGLAPFRGFCQQRALQKAGGRSLAPAILFVGCRSYIDDRLYANEFDTWVKEGVVDIRYAFSRDSGKSQGCKYVNERMVHDAEDLVGLWRHGARVYLCGSRKFAQSVRAAAEGLAVGVREREGQGGGDNEELEARFKAALQERVAGDVFD